MQKTLLLADDSLTVRRVIEQTFADEPIHVVTVGDGAAALARLESGPTDVLLADIGMPAPDGYELALHVRRTPALAHIPVILLTGAFDPVDHTRARDAGCAGVLVKPFDPQMLISRVRQLLQARRPAERPAVDHAAMNARTDPASTVSVHGPGTEPAALDELSATAVSSASPLSAVSRAAEVDDYFARLDRAFATLQAPREGDNRGNTSLEDPEPDAAREVHADTKSAEGAGTLARPPAGGEAEPVRAATIAPTDVAVQATHVTAPVVTPVAADDVARPSAVPTLGGAFAALLAIEQGQPLPPAASGWTPAPSAEVLEQIVRRVTQEIAEAVIRDLAPRIVSEVAERLVREETARVTSGFHPR